METQLYDNAISQGAACAIEAFGRPLGREAVVAAAETLLRRATESGRLKLPYRHLANSVRVLHRLLRLGYALRREEPGRYLAAAQAGVFLASRLSARGPHRAAVEDLRGEAWMHLGNARRIQEQLPASARAFGRAAAHLGRGTADPSLRAELLALEASLERAHGRLENARALLSEAIGLYEALGEHRLAALERLSLGLVTLYSGEPRQALDLLLAAGRSLDLSGSNWRLGLDVLHNSALCCAEMGAVQRAVVVLTDCIPLYEQSGDEVLHTRVGWVAGRILAHREDWEGAAQAFNLVRTSFTERGLSFDAALAGLELALAYLKLGRTGEVRALAEEMRPVFVAKQIPRAATAALLLFVKAARREALDAEAVAKLLADLKGRLAPPGRRGIQGRFIA